MFCVDINEYMIASHYIVTTMETYHYEKQDFSLKCRFRVYSGLEFDNHCAGSSASISSYNDGIMGAIASQITIVTQSFIQTQIKENIKAPRHWLLCGEYTGRPVNSPHKWPATRKMFPFDAVIMLINVCRNWFHLLLTNYAFVQIGYGIKDMCGSEYRGYMLSGSAAHYVSTRLCCKEMFFD